MTERGPFAVVAEYSLCEQVILSVGGYAVCSTNDKDRAFLDAARINDAYEARVKEAVDKEQARLLEMSGQREAALLARIAELERVLKLAYEGILLKGGCFYQDKCQGESLCVPCKALAEIKSVLGKEAKP